MKRIISLAVVLCMIFVMFPTTAFAAQSYGIYVGSTEVTSANYKNIKGPGISGKVSFDPNKKTLTLDNATITSYTDSAAGQDYKDLVGVYSLWERLNIQLVGKNTIQPKLSGKTAEYCTGLGTLGTLEISGEHDSSLTIKVNGANVNIGMLGVEKLTINYMPVHIECGDSSKGACYGIYTKDIYVKSNDLRITTGNCPAGESIGIFATNEITNYAETYITTGKAPFTCGIYADGSVSLEENTTIKTNTATEYDSIGIYSGWAINLNAGKMNITSGASEKGSSFALFSDGAVVSSDCKEINATSNSAPNGVSAPICCVGVVQLHSMIYTKVCLNAGTGLSSYGIFSQTREVQLEGVDIRCNAGTATQGDSIGVAAAKRVYITDILGEINGGYAPNGNSYGIYSDEKVQFLTQLTNKSIATGQDAAISTSQITIKPHCYWAGNPNNTDPLWVYHREETDPIGDPSQYKYIYVLTEEHLTPTPFKDVAKGFYYVEPVLWAVENNITTGTAPITFAPEATCTRGQVVTFLWRACGSPEPVSTEMPFTDVPEEMYYYKAVLWAVENKITNGITDTTFCPDNGCTRGQVATFLWRCLYEPKAGEENPFVDVNNEWFYYDAVLWAVENEITTGKDTTHFAPDDACTRGQIVTFLYRAADDLAVRPDEPPVVEEPTEPEEPSEPTEPVEPSEPTEDPTDPVEPSEPTEDPTDPVEPSEPTEDPADPTETPEE